MGWMSGVHFLTRAGWGVEWIIANDEFGRTWDRAVLPIICLERLRKTT